MSQTAEEVRAAIDDLQSLSRADLSERFRKLYRSEPPRQISRDLLLRAISHCLQEKATGSRGKGQLHRRLRSLAVELQQTGAISVTSGPPSTGALQVGTRLVREWQGTVHEVTVVDDGFVYRDQRYRSLSQIARLITGTRWSGPAFFGLNASKDGKGREGGG